jgi:hypothetical protein
MQTEFHDEVPDDVIREASEIATRALALFAVVGTALGAPKAETVEWLRAESLWDALSPAEASFFTDEPPSERQWVNASWRSEALLMLLWSLGAIDRLPGLNEQCIPGEFQAILPPFADVELRDFIATARRRPDAELLAMAESLLDSHWEARDARFNGRPMPSHLNIGIIQERHHGINWVIGYEGSPWDEVTTDT